MIQSTVLKIALAGTGAALLVALGGLAWQTMQLHDAEVLVERGKTEISKLREEHAQAQIDSDQMIKSLEGQITKQAQENQDALLKERAAARTAAAGFAAERQRLRNALTEYASGEGLTPDVAAATCSERAAALGRSLDETLRAEEELVGQLEDQRADTRTLLRDARTIRSLISTDRAGIADRPPVR